MIELRWIQRKYERPVKQSDLSSPMLIGKQYPLVTEFKEVLQYRALTSRVDASGALNVMPIEWTDWVDVLLVESEVKDK